MSTSKAHREIFGHLTQVIYNTPSFSYQYASVTIPAYINIFVCYQMWVMAVEEIGIGHSVKVIVHVHCPLADVA